MKRLIFRALVLAALFGAFSFAQSACKGYTAPTQPGVTTPGAPTPTPGPGY